MKIKTSCLRFGLAACFVAATIVCTAPSGSAASAGAKLPFPDFGFMPPPDQYHEAVFKLSQDYPSRKPGSDKLPDFFKRFPATPSPDFARWRDYMMALRDYCFEGNLEVDWRVENNKVRRWYHIPWQHYGPAGREGIHGLTKEAPVQPGQLGPKQGRPNTNDYYQTYAVGFFNELAGWTIGRVWADHMNPDPNVTNGRGGFPEGAVISKLLLVDVPPEQVAFLQNPQQWLGYIQAAYNNPNRSIRALSLIQMDVAVKDKRAPLGWVFGTFQYNGQLNNPVRWKNLIPVGIMWGNDPTITDDTYTNPTPTVTKINPNLKESSINPDTNELPPTHLGWNGRLNGPVDNPRSSCISCHMTAEVPALSALSPLFQAQPPPVGSTNWMRWFQNLECGKPFDSAAKSADYSLQLAIGIANFELWKAPAQSGLIASDYSITSNAPGTAPNVRALRAANPPAKSRVHPIARDIAPPESGK